MTTRPAGFNGSLRQSMSWLHTWAGLLLSILLYFMFVTGTAGYLTTEINRWMSGIALPFVPDAEIPSEAEMIATGVAHLQENVPGGTYWGMRLPHENRAETGLMEVFGDTADGDYYSVLLDPRDGTVVDPGPALETGGGDALYAMHYALHYMPEEWAWYIVGVATMFMLVAILTGIVVHKKIFKDLFTFRPGKGQRSWLDAHNLVSVLSLPFMVMITYSGLIFFTYEYMPTIVPGVYGAGEEVVHDFGHALNNYSGYHDTYDIPESGVPAGPFTDTDAIVSLVQGRWGEGQIGWFEITNAHDAAGEISVWKSRMAAQGYHDIFFFDAETGEERMMAWQTRTASDVGGLLMNWHIGAFADTILRTLYVLSGIAGSAMLATGMVLWTKKRRQALRPGVPAHLGIRLVERLNAGTILGLLIGILCYFLANRLLPADLEGRAQWEMNALFIAWSLMLLHGLIRPAAQIWREQAALGAVLALAIPVVNALTTDIHLGRTLPAGDWVLAGFDLSMLAAALFFVILARRAPAPGATRGDAAPDPLESETYLEPAE